LLPAPLDSHLVADLNVLFYWLFSSSGYFLPPALKFSVWQLFLKIQIVSNIVT